MEALDLFRKAAQRLSARGVGLDNHQPRVTVAQQRGSQSESDILGLPQDVTYWLPLQDAQHRFYLMADYDPEGAPGKVVR